MDDEVDPETLQRELREIKSAMGLHERYPGQFKLWLVFGVAVSLASAISQYLVLTDGPEYLHSVAWFLLLGGAGAYNFVAIDGGGPETTDKPNLGVQYLAVFLYVAVVLAILSQVQDATTTPEATIFAAMVGLTGVAYLVVGSTMKAYYIRDRDRYAFYVGGAWMLVLATVIPLVDTLQTYGFGAFGVLYAVHSVGSYVYLSRS
jgi:hypothetical protein